MPVRNWREENRELIRLISAETQPDVITFETLRFLDWNAVCRDLDLDILEEEFADAMRATAGTTPRFGCQIPDAFRHRVYRHIVDELEAAGPQTPYALCREQRHTWDLFADDFARHGQRPDRYVCNCGPTSSPDHPLCCAAEGSPSPRDG